MERPLFLTMTDSYCGAYGSAHRRGAEEWSDSIGRPAPPAPSPESVMRNASAFASIPLDRSGGFLFEPASSSGLGRFPPVRLTRNIVQKVREADGFILVNEVTTGLGREGRVVWLPTLHNMSRCRGAGLGAQKRLSGCCGCLLPPPRGAPGSPPKYAQSHQNDRSVPRLLSRSSG